MRATEVLQKCLGESLQALHSLRSRVLVNTPQPIPFESRDSDSCRCRLNAIGGR
jgi:hypothetical protein